MSQSAAGILITAESRSQRALISMPSRSCQSPLGPQTTPNLGRRSPSWGLSCGVQFGGMPVSAARLGMPVRPPRDQCSAGERRQHGLSSPDHGRNFLEDSLLSCRVPPVPPQRGTPDWESPEICECDVRAKWNRQPSPRGHAQAPNNDEQ